MNPDRREEIRTLLHSKPFVSLHELEEKFQDVSSMTLRRDIEYFEKQGEAIKVRGGAKSMKFFTTSMEDKFSIRSATNPIEKERLAKCAIELIETGRSLFLDSGTTMLKFAALMPDSRLTITTTGPNVALELVKKPQIITNIVGGMVNRDNISVSGNQAMEFIQNINIDIAFVVPSGVSAENGLTSGNYIECELKKMVVNKARKVVALIDSSKLDHSLPYTFATFENIDIIITDSPLPDDIMKKAAESNTTVVVA